MKKVLILTYYWPPSGGSGVQRWMYFCKYLPEFGFEPIVLTVSENSASYKNIDDSLVENVKNIETHKTHSFEFLKLYSLITTGSKKKGIPQGDVNSKNRGILNKAFIFLRGNFFIPDARLGWKKSAIKKAREIIVNENIEVVVTTGPPHSTHLIGLQLRKELSFKWVADFRDPWSELYYNKDLLRTKWATNKDNNLERKVLENADMILTIGFKLKEKLQNKVDGHRDKFHHIYNGYDSIAMKEISKVEHSYFEITFIGLLTDRQPYKSFISALKIVMNKLPNANIRILFAGNIHKSVFDTFSTELPTIKIDNRGYVSHKTALELMKSSQLLINFLAEMEGNEILISGKQMEYIATGNPILCIGNSLGEAAIILKDIDNGKIFEKEDTLKASDFILEVYEKWAANEPFLNNIDSKNIKDKSRYETTRQLAQLLKNIK